MLGRRRIANSYLTELSTVGGLALPAELENRQHAWHLFVIRCQPSGVERDVFIRELTARGIGTSVHWKPLHLHDLYTRRLGYGPGLFPVSEEAWPTLVSLPIFPSMSDGEMEQVVSAVRDIQRQPEVSEV